MTDGFRSDHAYYIQAHPLEAAWAFAGAFLSILTGAGIHSAIASHDLVYVIGSFGATAVLLFAAPKSPLSQPRNVMGGHGESKLACMHM